MAFLRSIAGSNQSSLVSRKILSSTSTPTSIRASIQRTNNAHQLLANRIYAGAESAAFQQRYFNSSAKCDINTTKHNAETANPLHKVQATSALNATIRDPNEAPSPRDPLDVSFNDPIAAFKSKTTSELIRAYFVYMMCSSEYLVENNMKVNFRFRATRKIWTCKWGPSDMIFYHCWARLCTIHVWFIDFSSHSSAKSDVFCLCMWRQTQFAGSFSFDISEISMRIKCTSWT